VKASDFVSQLPKGPGSQRDQMIYDAVRRRDMPPIEWRSITLKSGKHVGIINVSADTLRLGEPGDSIRVSGSHLLAQRIADSLGTVIPTAKIVDEIWRQADIQLPVFSHAWYSGKGGDGTMALTRRMADQNRQVDQAIVDRGGAIEGRSLIGNAGKDWVLDKRLWGDCAGQAVNYGWHGSRGAHRSATLPGVTVIQTSACKHGLDHTDYSQVIRLVRPDMTVVFPDGMAREMNIADVARDPVLAGLVSHQGLLEDFRHPGIDPSCEHDVRCTEIPPAVTGSQSAGCSVNCDKLPPVKPDPTKLPPPPVPSVPPVPALASAGGPLLPWAIGAAAGFFGASWLLDRYWK